MGQTIDLKPADGQAIPAYVANPKGTPKGGIVVIQEIFGVNEHIRAVVDGYAADGYLAIAPAIFHRVKPGVEMGYTPDDMGAGMALKTATEALPSPGAMQDIEAAIAYAAQAGKVGMVGYCYGGLLTWRSACELDGLSAAVAYYGGGTTTPDEIKRKPKCPVLAHYGDKDKHISVESVEAFRKAHPEVEVHLYEADHGFNCDHRGSWNAEAAKLARERSLAFFAKHLA
jgi:carboxymethylenebutenolidase